VSETEGRHVYEAIVAVTSAMAQEGISKSRSNQQQGYKFRSVDDVYAAVGRHLAANKLCMLPRVTDRATAERPTKSGGVSTYTTLTVEFDLVSAVDGSSHTICTVGEAMDSADKSSNKSMSAAFKYACFLAFQIPTEGDNDADFFHHEPTPRNQDLTPVLEASVAWGTRELEMAKCLKAATNMGELLEAWSVVSEKGKSAPNGTLKRLALVKDEQKARLSKAQASP
jgi:hypothetical protein